MPPTWPPRWWPFGRGKPPLPPPPPPPPPGPGGPDPFALQILAAHNAERAARGLPPLAPQAALQGMADGHAHVMAAARIMDHDRAGDGSFPARLARSGYAFSGAGENIAAGEPDIPTVMASWMASPLHRVNILGDFTEAGCQVALDASGRAYWCVDFGKPPG